MGFDLNVSIPILTVFAQGILSFFSPCVLPLLPVYLGYLSGGTLKRKSETGAGDKTQTVTYTYDRRKVFINTVFFVIGVSAAFFLLGLGVTAFGQFLSARQHLLARVGGGVMILFGLYQLGLFGASRLLSREFRLPFLQGGSGGVVAALLLGFTFSFSWTPCVGPALATVLIMASTAGTAARGFLLIGVYTLGFVLPFLALGLSASTLLGIFNKHRNLMKYTVKIGGVLMILLGLMVFTGKMNDITGYLSTM